MAQHYREARFMEESKKRAETYKQGRSALIRRSR